MMGIMESDWGNGSEWLAKAMAAELLGVGVGGFGVEDGGGVKYTNFPMVLGLTTRAPVKYCTYPSRTTGPLPLSLGADESAANRPGRDRHQMIGWKVQTNLPAKIYLLPKKEKRRKKIGNIFHFLEPGASSPLACRDTAPFTRRKKKWRNILPLPRAWRFSPLAWSRNLRRTDLSSLEFV